MRFLLLVPLLASGAALAQTPADPYLWLEEVSSPRAMEWVTAHNQTTTTALEADPRYATLFSEALAIAEAKDRIPRPSFLHGELFNFWQDPDHQRGLWRKTTLADYQTAEPHWKTVLDVDALNKAEGKSWVFHGVDCLQPEERLCLVSLSDGGEDATVERELDLVSGAFVADGFTLPRGKHRATWEDADTLLLATEWAPGELTTSGYPYIVKRLKRGQPLSAAVEVFRGAKNDGGYGVAPMVLVDGAGNTLTVIERPLDTFRHELYLLEGAKAQRLGVPAKVQLIGLVEGRVVFQLDEPWTAGGHRFEAGALVQTELAATRKSPGALKPSLIWAPGPREALGGTGSRRPRCWWGCSTTCRARRWPSAPRRAAGSATSSRCRRTWRSPSARRTSARTAPSSAWPASSRRTRCG
jgi:prolyl oligopeptidase